jgi:hypothetical protein
MASFEIDTTQLQRAADALDAFAFRKLADQTVGAVLVRAGNAVRRHVRNRAAPHRRSGHMAGRVQYKRQGVGVGTTVTVYAGGPVAHLLEGGTRPHEIGLGKAAGQLGGSGKALTIRGSGSVNSRWAGAGSKGVRGAGADILAVRTGVHHPGNRAVPFFADGVDDSEAEVQGIIDRGAATMANNLAFHIERGGR